MLLLFKRGKFDHQQLHNPKKAANHRSQRPHGQKHGRCVKKGGGGTIIVRGLLGTTGSAKNPPELRMTLYGGVGGGLSAQGDSAEKHVPHSTCKSAEKPEGGSTIEAREVPIGS